MEESRDEGRRERRMVVDERRRATLRVLPCDTSFAAMIFAAALVGLFDFLEPRRHTQRHSPDVLDETEPQHRRNRPELAHSERRDPLILAHEQRDVIERDVAFGVRDQLDRYFVHARIIRQRAVRELRQLLIVAAREIRSYLPDVLLHDVVIVEQPLAGGADYVGLVFRGCAETLVNFCEDVSRIIETLEQRAVASLFLRRKQLVLPRDVARVLRQPVRAEDFTTDGTCELPIRAARASEKAEKSVGGFFWR